MIVLMNPRAGKSGKAAGPRENRIADLFSALGETPRIGWIRA